MMHLLRGLRSIRWRLPLSYAAIALVAALVLGAILITILNDFYAEQERRYLEANARFVSMVISQAQDAGQTIEQIEPQLVNMAAFSGARIELVDDEGNIVLDSGQPRNYFVFGLPRPVLFNAPFTDALMIAGQEDDSSSFIVSGLQALADSLTTVLHLDANGRINGISQFSAEGGGGGGTGPAAEFRFIPSQNIMSGTVYEQVFDGQLSEADFTLSTDNNVTVQVPFATASENTQIGTGAVRFSSGFSVGQEIMNSVIRGWVIAGAVAVILAALVGWVISLNITRPVLELNRIASRMAAGDLAVRLRSTRGDELGTLANTFNRMATQIESTVETLRHFVADAAHEIHTPLTALRTNLELMLESCGDVNRLPVRRALGQVERLQILADDLLDLSRLESRADTTPREPLKVEALIRDVCEVYASRAEQSGIDFELHFASSIQQATVYAHQSQLRRLLMNLLDNALKFTPEGGTVRVQVTLEGGEVCITVQDDGIGIPPEDLPYLFNRFKRGKNTANYAGSGLGLAIVKAIADVHGGAVHARSDASGTFFTARFPSV